LRNMFNWNLSACLVSLDSERFSLFRPVICVAFNLFEIGAKSSKFGVFLSDFLASADKSGQRLFCQ
jgi:hypothetical protein